MDCLINKYTIANFEAFQWNILLRTNQIICEECVQLLCSLSHSNSIEDHWQPSMTLHYCQVPEIKADVDRSKQSTMISVNTSLMDMPAAIVPMRPQQPPLWSNRSVLLSIQVVFVAEEWTGNNCFLRMTELSLRALLL